MTKDKEILWGYVWKGDFDSSTSVTLCDNEEAAIKEIQDVIRTDCQYLENPSDYYLVKIEKVERFYLPEIPEIKREKL